MGNQQFEPGRAVEVIARSYGSAYRIGGSLVLTAAHLVAEVGSDCHVRDKENFGKAEAKVVWKAEQADIALIELPKGIEPCEAVVLGLLPKPRAGGRLEFQMYCWPAWARTEREQGRSAAGGRQIDGWIYLADRSPDGLLVLQANRSPREGLSVSSSEWEGASGAAVVCDGLVIAVQTQHQNPQQPASLEATPLSTIYNDQQWSVLLQQHGINPRPAIARLRAEVQPPSNPPPRNLPQNGEPEIMNDFEEIEGEILVNEHKYNGELVFIELKFSKEPEIVEQSKIGIRLTITFGVFEENYSNNYIKFAIKNGKLRLNLTNGYIPVNQRSLITEMNDKWMITTTGVNESPVWEFKPSSTPILQGMCLNTKLGIINLLDTYCIVEATFNVSPSTTDIQIIAQDGMWDSKTAPMKRATKIAAFFKRRIKPKLQDYVSKVELKYGS